LLPTGNVPPEVTVEVAPDIVAVIASAVLVETVVLAAAGSPIAKVRKNRTPANIRLPLFAVVVRSRTFV
jgi:hypothetical protein